MKGKVHGRKVLFVFAASAVALTAPSTPLPEESLSSSSSSSSSSTRAVPENDNNEKDSTPSSLLSSDDGQIVQSLFRFPASQLGPEFDAILQKWHSSWLHSTQERDVDFNETALAHSITPDASGTRHALRAASTPSATLFRRQCYFPAPLHSSQLNNLYKNYEQRRKAIAFEYNQDSMEEMRLMHTMTNRFSPAFLLPEYDTDAGDANGDGDSVGNKHKRNKSSTTSRIHRKKSISTVNTIHEQSGLPSKYDSPSKLAYQTTSTSINDDGDNNHGKKQKINQEWSWYPPAHFTSRGTPFNVPFRMQIYQSLREDFQTELQSTLADIFETGFEHARLSGMYWYPPGGVREWHSNYLDLVGNTKHTPGNKNEVSQKTRHEEEIFSSQTWRMYYIRTVRDNDFDEKLSKLRKTLTSVGMGEEESSSEDCSAMHILPGDDEGVTLDVLQNAGARLLTKEEERRQWSDDYAQDYSIPAKDINDNSNSFNGDTDNIDTTTFDRNAVWRLPDRNGYVTLFRLPKLWHCIVSEEVHRYSLGFAFSEREVRALLTLAGVPFDVVDGERGISRKQGEGNGNSVDVDGKDEL